MADPNISAVCSFYNRADHVRATVDSLLGQDCVDFEVIVVNDGSPDPRVRAILDSYDDPRLRILHQQNTGLTTALRRAVAAARGRYIALQGAGDISFSNRLARQARFLDAHPDFAVIGCGLNNALVSGEAGGPPPLPVDQPGFNGSGPNAGALKLEARAETILHRNPFTHGEVMIRRDAYEAVGGYRTVFANAQDKDLWLRLIGRYRLGVLEDWLYQRHSFTADGIAANLGKLLVQTAYSMLGEQCYRQRQAGRTDDVERYGALALMNVPMGPRTTRRVLRSVRQAGYYGTLEPAQLRVVGDLYGPFNHALAWLVWRYMAARK